MQIKKTPLRKCTGCNEMKQKKELVRVVKNKDGEIALDHSGKMSGRGAYICLNAECFKKARKQRGFERAFSCKIEEEIYNQVEAELKIAETASAEVECG